MKKCAIRKAKKYIDNIIPGMTIRLALANELFLRISVTLGLTEYNVMVFRCESMTFIIHIFIIQQQFIMTVVAARNQEHAITD